MMSVLCRGDRLSDLFEYEVRGGLEVQDDRRAIEETSAAI